MKDEQESIPTIGLNCWHHAVEFFQGLAVGKGVGGEGGEGRGARGK